MRYSSFYSLIVLFLIYSCQDTTGTYLIKDVTIYDGSGADAYTADLIIADNIIKKIGNDLSCSSCEEINHDGLAIAPGFIDVHAHLEPLPSLPSAESALHMGVTTALGGPDGFSPVDLGTYLDSLEQIRTGINVAYLIGHNSVRTAVMQLEGRTPSEEELLRMKALIVKGMEDGAFGLSTGLKYLPGTFAETSELISLSKEVAEMGGIYTSHLREEGLGLLEGVREAIEIAREAAIPVVLTHHKAIGLPMWGKSSETLAMVDAAREQGLAVMLDQYPYTASHTGLSVLIPPWAMEGGPYTAFATRCKDPILRDSIKAGIIYNILNDRGGGDLKRIQFARFKWKPWFGGKTLYDWAIEEGLEPTAAHGAELVIQAQLQGGANAIYHAISEEDVIRIMQHPQTMIASDGRITAFGKGFPHPRVHGTFPRVIGHYARDKKLLSISEAIRKMTSLPAARLGLSDRGLIKENYIADLVLFDEHTIIDKATFKDPHQYPEGIVTVFVNGRIALHKNNISRERSGKILRGPSFKK